MPKPLKKQKEIKGYAVLWKVKNLVGENYDDVLNVFVGYGSRDLAREKRKEWIERNPECKYKVIPITLKL